jgi:hypothetical protein
MHLGCVDGSATRRDIRPCRYRQASDASGTVAFHADASKACLWYQKAADAGEPNALARFAERDDRDALAEADPAGRNALWLLALIHYAAAVARAHHEDWPDDTWKNWRYRRATLRALARTRGHDAAGGQCVRQSSRTAACPCRGSKLVMGCACESIALIDPLSGMELTRVKLPNTLAPQFRANSSSRAG